MEQLSAFGRNTQNGKFAEQKSQVMRLLLRAEEHPLVMKPVLLSISSACGTVLGTGGELIPCLCRGTTEETALTPLMETGDAVIKGKPEFARRKIGKGCSTPAWLCHLQIFSTLRIKKTQRILVI